VEDDDILATEDTGLCSLNVKAIEVSLLTHNPSGSLFRGVPRLWADVQVILELFATNTRY
jgi:hypothetical protein